MNYHDLLLLLEQIIFSHLAHNKGRKEDLHGLSASAAFPQLKRPYKLIKRFCCFFFPGKSRLKDTSPSKTGAIVEKKNRKRNAKLTCVKFVREVQSWFRSSFRYMPGGVVGVTRVNFAGYVPLASQSSYPIIVYSVANYRTHLSHFWANM